MNGGGRPAAARGRQNSTQSIVENAKQRPSSAASNKPNPNTVATPNVSAPGSTTGRILPDMKPPPKETVSTSKEEQSVEDTEQEESDVVGPSIASSRKEAAMKREEPETNGDLTQDIRSTTITMTKSGRASKPSTPHISNFEPVRSRSARNALEAASSNKRSHKKGAGAAAQQLLAARGKEDEDASSIQGDEDDDDDINPDEPRYCYCNGVSYGEMVGCDGDTCEREWFHLECVGLKVAPKDKGTSHIAVSDLSRRMCRLVGMHSCSDHSTVLPTTAEHKLI